MTLAYLIQTTGDDRTPRRVVSVSAYVHPGSQFEERLLQPNEIQLCLQQCRPDLVLQEPNFPGTPPSRDKLQENRFEAVGRLLAERLGTIDEPASNLGRNFRAVVF